MNMRKKLLVVCMMISIMAGLIGCGSTDREEIQMEAEPQLTVYTVEGIDFYDQAVTAFQGKYKEMKIDYVTFETEEDLARQYSNDVAMGTQPDVLLLTDETTIDVFKACKNYRFANLTPYFESDEAFYDVVYFEEALKAGCYEDKQYIVPFRMEIPYYLLTNKVTDVIDVKALREANGQEQMQLLMDAADAVKEQGIMEDGVFYATTSVEQILRSSGISLCGLQDEHLELDKEQIRLLCEYTKYVTEDCMLQMPKRQESTDVMEQFGMMGIEQRYDNPFYMGRSYDMMFEYLFGEDLEWILATAVDEAGAYHADITKYGMVDAESDNVRGAYQLLRYLMDYKTRADFATEIYVHRSNTTTEFVNMSEYTNLGSGIRVSAMGYSKYLRVENMLNSLTDISIPNHKVEEIYKSVAQDYYAGNREFEDMYMELENRLTIYWKE